MNEFANFCDGECIQLSLFDLYIKFLEEKDSEIPYTPGERPLQNKSMGNNKIIVIYILLLYFNSNLIFFIK